MHKDALGSIDLITDAHANVVDRRSFDAWGKLRNLPWQAMAALDDPLYLTQLPFTNKGYTGHENVQEVNLIHMNGRMYDATLARFISADPHIQAGALSQNYNRYSYVMNNPMKYTDPSGFFFKKLFSKVKRALSKAFNAVKPYVGLIATLAVGVFCIPCTAGIISSAITGAAIGALGAAATGGNILQGALLGGFTAGSARWIGGAEGIFGTARNFDIGRSLAHGAVGGITNVIRGGKFGAGFVSSAFTKFVSDPIQGYAKNLAGNSAEAEIFYGTAGAALVGGTASELGGGKFANGAQTAAMQYLYNQIGEKVAQDAQKGHDCDRVCMNKIDGLTEQDVLTSIEDGTGWSREYRDAWHNMGVEPGTNRKYTNTEGREAVFTTNEAGLNVPVTDHNGPTFNYGRNNFTHTIRDVIPYLLEGAGPNDTTNFWDRITVCTIGCSLE